MTDTAPDARARKKADRELASREPIIQLLAQELAAQRAGYAQRASSMNTRLSILVAAASLATGMQVDLTAPHLWYVVGACFAALAAIAGVIALWPRSGGENGIEELQREIWNESPTRAAFLLIHRQLEVLKEDENHLSTKARRARIGYLLLALSIVAVALHVAFTN